MNDGGHYCLKGLPVPMPSTTRVATAVEAHFNDVAKLAISEHNTELLIFDPAREKEMKKSMRPAEFKDIDQVYKS